jgi:hypothetical protein
MCGTYKKGDEIIDFDNKDVGNKEFKMQLQVLWKLIPLQLLV